MEMNFCRRCGAELQPVERHIYRCVNGHVHYANSYPTVGIFVFDAKHDILLSVRGIDPGKGMLDTFGGFLDENETLEAAAIRELQEEAGLQAGDYEPLRYFTSGATTYQYGDETLPIVTAYYYTRLKKDVVPVAGDDTAEIRSAPLHSIGASELAADDARHGLRELQKLFPL